MSMLTGRYSGNPETAFDYDIRFIEKQGLDVYVNAVIEASLQDSFWSTLLPQQMDTSSGSSPYFLVFQAAQVKLNERGFLSRDITVQALILNHNDVHHIFPRNYLKGLGLNAALQPDCQLRPDPKRDQHRHRGRLPGRVLRCSGRTVSGQKAKIRRHHRSQ